MSLIIDGHNLIGVLPDIRLGDPDDEQRLLARLRAYRAASRGQAMIVFFDSGDAPARAADPSSPGIQVRFARPGQTADDAIVAYLAERTQPGQYAVVTNDGELARRVREVGASLIRASDFAIKLGRPAPRAAPQADASGLDPRDPAFADLFAGFIQAERQRAVGLGQPLLTRRHGSNGSMVTMWRRRSAPRPGWANEAVPRP